MFNQDILLKFIQTQAQKNQPVNPQMQPEMQPPMQRGGSPIVTSRGQWDYPGQVTRIPSNRITMQGVPYPVLGVSDTGHSQMMSPGGEYMFDGNSVTEYPMAQQGGFLNEHPNRYPMLQVGGRNVVNLRMPAREEERSQMFTNDVSVSPAEGRGIEIGVGPSFNYGNFNAGVNLSKAFTPGVSTPIEYGVNAGYQVNPNLSVNAAASKSGFNVGLVKKFEEGDWLNKYKKAGRVREEMVEAPMKDLQPMPVNTTEELVNRVQQPIITSNPEPSFAGAFDRARMTGESEFTWDGKRYSADLATSRRPVVETPQQSAEMANDETHTYSPNTRNTIASGTVNTPKTLPNKQPSNNLPTAEVTAQRGTPNWNVDAVTRSAFGQRQDPQYINNPPSNYQQPQRVVQQQRQVGPTVESLPPQQYDMSPGLRMQGDNGQRLQGNYPTFAAQPASYAPSSVQYPGSIIAQQDNTRVAAPVIQRGSTKPNDPGFIFTPSNSSVKSVDDTNVNFSQVMNNAWGATQAPNYINTPKQGIQNSDPGYSWSPANIQNAKNQQAVNEHQGNQVTNNGYGKLPVGKTFMTTGEKITMDGFNARPVAPVWPPNERPPVTRYDIAPTWNPNASNFIGPRDQTPEEKRKAFEATADHSSDATKAVRWGIQHLPYIAAPFIGIPAAALLSNHIPENAAQVTASMITGDSGYGIEDASPEVQKGLLKSLEAAHSRNKGKDVNKMAGTEYKDYGPEMENDIQHLRGSIPDIAIGSMVSPEFNAATTYGRVSYKYNPQTDSYDVYDSYDFSKTGALESTYSKIRNFVGDLAVDRGIAANQNKGRYIGTVSAKDFAKYSGNNPVKKIQDMIVNNTPSANVPYKTVHDFTNRVKRKAYEIAPWLDNH